MQIEKYLYLLILIPAASAVAGFSPTALSSSPVRVLFSTYAVKIAIAIATYVIKLYDSSSSPTIPALPANGSGALNALLVAEKGHAEAQNRMGACYYEGEAVEKNYDEAARWWKLSADQGNMSAQYDLGICYYNGHGVERNFEKAMELWHKSAAQGNADAIGMLKMFE